MTGSLIMNTWSIDAHGRRLGQPAEWPSAADTIPGILHARWLAFAFVALQESRHEELFGKRGKLRSAGFAVADDAVRIVEVDHLDHRPWLRGIVADFVTLGGLHRFRTSQPHQRVSVGWRHVDTAF